MNEIVPRLHLEEFDSDKDVYFYANTFSDHIEKHHLHVLTPHNHDFYVIVLFSSGSGTHEIDFTEYSIEKGQLFFMRPGQTHNWKFDNDTDGFVILFSAKFIQHFIPQTPIAELPFFSRVNPLNCIHAEAEDYQELLSLIQKMYASYSKARTFHRQECASLLSLFLLFSNRISETGSSTSSLPESYLKIYSGFISDLENSWKELHLVEEYAGRAGVSTRHLTRVCMEVKGLSAGTIIADKLLLEAQKMIASDQRSLQETSEEAGFTEYSYFSRWFRKQSGMTPEAFRRKHVQN